MYPYTLLLLLLLLLLHFSAQLVYQWTLAGGDVSFTLELTTPACPVKEEFNRLSKVGWCKSKPMLKAPGCRA